MENKICQNCKKEFAVTSEDFTFYESIKVPAPTHCPDCRSQRRMAWLNERFLYPRKCDGSGKPIITIYNPEVPFPVYSREYWFSDAWDALTYGREYDPSRPFLEQFNELQKMVPRLQMWLVNSVNSDYSNYVVDSKDCYLCFTALGGNENCSYSGYLTQSTQCLDCYLIHKCELCVGCVNCDTCYNLKCSTNCKNCRDSWFLLDCNNCTNCVGCVGLRDKQYCIFNDQFTKEEYIEKIKELGLENRSNWAKIEEKVSEVAKPIPRRFMQGTKNQNVSGDYISNSKDITAGYMVNDCEDGRYLYFTNNSKGLSDITVCTVSNELLHECHAIPKNNYSIKFSELCANGCRELEYCISCFSSSNLFGCVGLRGKEYCILNKQYTKEDYEKLRAEIVENMKKDGSYGEFFPMTMSPFPYNETLAQEHFPLTENEASSRGLTWRKWEKRTYAPAADIFECQHRQECGHPCIGAFRVIPQEKAILDQLNLPAPIECPNCRHAMRITRMRPPRFYARKCANCSKEINSTFAPEGPEIVYCEECYQKETI